MRASAWLASLVFLCSSACVPTSSTVPREWLSVPVALRIGSVALDAAGTVTHRPDRPNLLVPDGPIRADGAIGAMRLMNGEKALTDPLPAIDSFDHSESRKEVVFSATRPESSDFDIGLVSADGSPIQWIPSDPADETGVMWAPRGNKISYVVRAKGGSVVRTVHVPTAFQLSAGFPNATIHALSWDPQAERYAVAYSTPETSDQVEVLKYDGSDRRKVIEPAASLDVDVEPFATDALLLRPREILYDEKLPLVLWVAEDFAWNDARGALMRNARLAVVVTTRLPDEELWKRVSETPWIDGSRLYVVATSADRAKVAAPRATLITGDPGLRGAQWRREDGVVTVAPRVVQSVAAGLIADQLKRTHPTNVRSR